MSLQNIPLTLSLVLMNTISIGLYLYKLPYLRKYFTEEDSTLSLSHAHVGTQACRQAIDDVYSENDSKKRLSSKKIIAWRDEHSKLTLRVTLNVIGTIQKEINERNSCRVCVLGEISDLKPKSKRKTKNGAKITPIYTIKKRSYNRCLTSKKPAVSKKKIIRGISYIAFDKNNTLSCSQFSQKDSLEMVEREPTLNSSSQTTDGTTGAVSSVQSFETVMDLERQLMLGSIEEKQTSTYLDEMTFYLDGPPILDQLARNKNPTDNVKEVSEQSTDYTSLSEKFEEPDNFLKQAEGDRTENDKVRPFLSGIFGFAASSSGNTNDSSDISMQFKTNSKLNPWCSNPCEMRNLESLRKVFISEPVLTHFNTNISTPKLLDSNEPSTSTEVCLPDIFSENVINDSELVKDISESVQFETILIQTDSSPAVSSPIPLPWTDLSLQGDTSVNEIDDDCFELAESTRDSPSTSGVSFTTAEEGNDGEKKKKRKIKRIFSSLWMRSKRKVSLKNKKESHTVDNNLGGTALPTTVSKKWFRKNKKP